MKYYTIIDVINYAEKFSNRTPEEKAVIGFTVLKNPHYDWPHLDEWQWELAKERIEGLPDDPLTSLLKLGAYYCDVDRCARCRKFAPSLRWDIEKGVKRELACCDTCREQMREGWPDAEATKAVLAEYARVFYKLNETKQMIGQYNA